MCDEILVCYVNKKLGNKVWEYIVVFIEFKKE